MAVTALLLALVTRVTLVLLDIVVSWPTDSLTIMLAKALAAAGQPGGVVKVVLDLLTLLDLPALMDLPAEVVGILVVHTAAAAEVLDYMVKGLAEHWVLTHVLDVVAEVVAKTLTGDVMVVKTAVQDFADHLAMVAYMAVAVVAVQLALVAAAALVVHFLGLTIIQWSQETRMQ
jgi:hypothetical protein